MDFKEAFNRELFRPLATIIAPGATLVAPYTALLMHYQRDLIFFWHDNSGSVLLILAVFTVAAGLALEDIGAQIESRLWDTKLDAENGVHLATWHKYLLTTYELNREPIGQHYLRSVVLRLKFELGLSVALFGAWPGWLWLYLVTDRFSTYFFAPASVIWLASAGYVLRESFESSHTLGEVRHLLIHGTPAPKSTWPAAK